MKKSKKKYHFLFFIIIVIIIMFCSILFFENIKNIQIIENSQNLQNLQNIKNVQNIKQDIKNIKISNFKTSNLEIYFCPNKICENKMNFYLNNSKRSIKCAFYDLNLNKTINILNQKNKEKEVKVEIIIDDKNIVKNLKFDIYSDKKRGTKYNNYMHHKFCIIDNEILITGSMNPTENGVYKNNNNLIILKSKEISQNYLKEFDLLKNHKFGYNKNQFEKYEILNLNSEEKINIKNYFCPQDRCREKILKEFKNAKKSIYFASFVFTDDILSEFLYNFSKRKQVKGIIEKRMINIKGSDFNILKNFTLIDKNKYTMHHKFFIIDNETLITGSMNPSNSGINYNDENILIIKNTKIINSFIKEFEKLNYLANKLG